MTLKYISSVLAGDSTDVSVARTAALIAEEFHAHLDVIHVVPRAEDIVSVTAAAGGLPSVAGMTIEAEAERLQDRAARARENFDASTGDISRVDVPGPDDKATCRFTEVEGRFGEVGLMPARVADLCVAALPGEEGSPGAWQAAETLLFDTGRPVLLVPENPDADLSVREAAIVGWNASAQAARALHDALPLLGRASDLIVVGAGESHDLEQPARALARHGVDAETISKEGQDEAGEVLLSVAAEHDANLIVMGAFGQSRLREFIFGGATQTVLHKSTVPVLMAH